MDIADLQRLVRDTYGERDRRRGLPRTYAWFVEEVGELSRALFRGDAGQRREEFADVLAWLVSLADLADVPLDETVSARYAHGCPKCAARRCTCPDPAGR
ncbi:MAG TPA: MazG nucleotide pyrophosphohydrolase domain-containing protein [Nitriliruptorales bacterium]|nr:MazG nucleotide pyrophosphohydrolase domain-containing protein [Nitriliruptorales bacterium]